MPDNQVIAVYEGVPHAPSLPGLCGELFDTQKTSWRALREAVEGLEGTRRREIRNDGHSFLIQLNPGRSKSVEAGIDAATIEKRPCFLCLDHLPPEQKGILYRNTFVILCNPFPIFSPHFTMVHRKHLPQSLGENLATFLAMARDLSPTYSVFYNGPRCGASAPDHLHFQGCPTGAIPVERESEGKGGAAFEIGEGISLRVCDWPGRHFLRLEGTECEGMASVLATILRVMGCLAGGGEEAMLNVIASFADGRWRAFLFPRRKHRPAVFFREGEGRRVITPGAVEMGGLVITTRTKDFAALDLAELIRIYDEVSVDREALQRIVDAVLDYYG